MYLDVYPLSFVMAQSMDDAIRCDTHAITYEDIVSLLVHPHFKSEAIKEATWKPFAELLYRAAFEKNCSFIEIDVLRDIL